MKTINNRWLLQLYEDVYQIKIPKQSNITGPNNSNMVAGSVFGNLYEVKNTESMPGNVSVIPSVLPTLPEKQRLSPT